MTATARFRVKMGQFAANPSNWAGKEASLRIRKSRKCKCAESSDGRGAKRN